MPTFEDGPEPASLIGVIIACSGNVLISLALTIQKLAHQRREAESRKQSPVGRAQELDADLHPHTPPWRRTYGTHVVTPSPIHEHAEQLFSALEREQTSSSDKLARGDTCAETDATNTLAPVFPMSPITSPLALAPPFSPDDPSPSPTPSPTRRAPSPTEAGYLRSRLWWLGLSLMGLGEAGNFLSYGFAPASVIAPLGTVALIANCVFAPLVLGEVITRRNVLGVALAIIGAVTIVWSSRDDNKRLSPEELLAAITALPFALYTAINVALLFPLTYLSASHWGDKYIGIDVGLCALFGGYTVMATKALSSLLSLKFVLALEYPIAWAAIAVLVITSVLQIKFLNRALMRFESKEVIPTQFVFFSLSAIVGSAVLYQEFRGVSRSDFMNFAFGIATTFLGVYFLTTPSDTILPADEESAPLFSTPDRPPPGYLAASSSALSTPLPPGLSPLLGPTGTQASLRVARRTSTPNIDITHALTWSSPGALFLRATTPPVSALTTPATITARVRHASIDSSRPPHVRSRSTSRGTVDRGDRGRDAVLRR